MKFSRRSFIKLSTLATLSTAISEVVGAPLEETESLPALFIGHGSPMNAIENNEWTESWRRLGESLPRPKAILSISAHWQSKGASYVTSNARQKVIYDMYGFPEDLYKVQYPAPGLPALAKDIAEVSTDRPILATQEWGLDHGTWSVLAHLYPNADIPVLQLSMDANLSPAAHFALGRELLALRKRGVLIMGSGNIVHNLRLRGIVGNPFDWAIEFDELITQYVTDRDLSAAVNFHSLGRIANLAHPTVEHYLPLIYVLGLVEAKDKLTWFNEGFFKRTLGMRSLIIS